MELRGVTLADSPEGDGRVRLSGQVAYDDGFRPPEIYWFDLPAAHTDEGVARSGNAWLAALLPLAVTLGEPLRLALPVDAVLLANLRRMMAIWHAWYPARVPVALEPDGVIAPVRRGPGRTVALFSGGVDSFFTALGGHRDEVPGPPDELLTIWGFDVPLARPEAFARLRERFRGVGKGIGVAVADVATNLRITRWREAPWGPLAHGCALAAAALTLEPRYSTVFIAATGGYRDLHPWGSHPLTDPLYSTSMTTFVHDGAAFTRVEKMEALLASPVAMSALRVCWRSESDHNCGACPKCYRAMLILELLGAAGRCATFPAGPVDPRRAARVFCSEPWDFREFRDIRSLAVGRGRPDLARAAERAMRRSRRLARRLTLAQAVSGVPVLHRWSPALQRRLLSGWIA